MKKTSNKSKSKIELLAPAGNFACLRTAINAGADAVYLGVQGFNMRQGAKNFKISDLKTIKQICSKKENPFKKQVKIYLTLNTIIYDNELKKLETIIKTAKKHVDAIICWDLSVINLCRKYKIPFHISTQASVSNSEVARFYKKLGAQRIILARELNIKQIKEISKIIETECFVHGAMCVSISGRCFTSQFLFKKSANRGQCLHPCRRAYSIKDNEGNELKLENNKVMSAKDLCALPFIEKLKKAGIKSFKIEGRNREPNYVDTVIRIYRQAIDNKLSDNQIKDYIKELDKVYNKGFSSGFFLSTPTNDDFSKLEHSASNEKKQFIGKIEHYFSNQEVAAIKLCAGKIKLGDEILVIGDNIGIIRHKIQRIEINKKQVKTAKKSQTIGIKILGAKKGNEIYLIKKK